MIELILIVINRLRLPVLRLDLYRNSRHHPDHLVRAGRDPLIHLSHGIPELSGERIVRNNPGADFIGNQYDRACSGAQAFNQAAGLRCQEIFWRIGISACSIIRLLTQSVRQSTSRTSALGPMSRMASERKSGVSTAIQPAPRSA